MAQPKTAKEIMVTKLVTLSPNEHVYDGIAGLLKNNITGAPVIDGQKKYLGVFSEKCCMNVLDVMARSVWGSKPNTKGSVPVSQAMATKLVSLAPESDAFDAIEKLLKNRISGAPVLDSKGKFLGVFSEKDSMRVLISGAYDQLPSTNVGSLMNASRERMISPDTDLLEAAQKFSETSLRRLAVVDDEGVLVGQVSRRDILRAEAEKAFSDSTHHPVSSLASQISELIRQGQESNDPEVNEANSYTRFETSRIAYFMDQNAQTISEETGFLGIAQLFLDTPYRRLPVLRDGELIGQISRRDLLRAANELFPANKDRGKSLLYLSSLMDRKNCPIG